MQFWSGIKIDTLGDNEIFVFGSNPSGIHGAGAAKTAVKFGAKYGVGRGLSGKAYALITKNLKPGFIEKATGITYSQDGYRSVSKAQISANIDELYEVARSKPDHRFLIAYQYETWPNGSPKKSLNGYTSKELFDLFTANKDIPSNIVFHDSYEPLLNCDLTRHPK